MPRQALKALRRAYAEELRIAGPVRNNPKVIEAFATVPRENFLPPGPWTIHGIVKNLEFTRLRCGLAGQSVDECVHLAQHIRLI